MISALITLVNSFGYFYLVDAKHQSNYYTCNTFSLTIIVNFMMKNER